MKDVIKDDARFFADPAFAPAPVAALLSKDYAASRRKLINPNRAGQTYDAGTPTMNHGDTITKRLHARRQGFKIGFQFRHVRKVCSFHARIAHDSRGGVW